MRPLRLEIEGFTVYRKPQIVDFEKLSFFVIQGKTGAGKTSLIDAITYALYGRVPRYGASKAHRLVLSRGSRRLRVALDFSVGGRRFRVERLYTSRPEESSARAYEEGRRLNLTSTQIDRWVEQVTGLDYRTFTRVILLPQGEFDRFLKPSSPRERRDILIGLLNLEIFERIRQMASEEYRKLEGELNLLRKELAQLEPLTEESLRNLRSRIERLQKEIEHLRGEVEREKELLRKAEERDRTQEELRQAQEKLKEAEAKIEKLGDLEERIRLARRILPFLPYLQRLEEVEEELREVRLTRERILKERLKLEGEMANIEEELRRAEKEHARLPLLRKELQQTLLELDRLSRAVEEERRLRKLEKEAEAKKRLLSEERKLLEECESRLRKGEEVLKATERELKDIAYDEEDYLRLLRESARRETLLEKERRLGEVEKSLEELRKKQKILAEEYDRLREKERELREKSLLFYAHLIREELEEGDSCPVCGGVYRERESAPEAESVERLRRELEELREEIEGVGRELSEVSARVEALAGERENLSSELEEGRELLESDLPRRLAEMEERRKRKREVESRLEKYRTAYTELLQKRDALLTRIGKLEAEVDSLEKMTAEKRELLSELAEDTRRLPEALKSLRVKASDLEVHIRKVEREWERIRSYREDLLRKLSALKAKLEETEELVRRLERQRKESVRRLAPLFEEVGDYERIRSASLSEEEIRSLEEEISRLHRERELAQERVSALSEKLASFPDIPPTQQLSARLSEREAELEKALRDLGESRAELRQSEELLRRKEVMVKRVEELERSLSVYGKLREDLKSDRLQDFAATLMLKRIVERSSAYLLDFSGTYEFDLNDRGDLVVIDRAQGAERDVKSLSGGETFLASLSLALGVSDILSSTARLESLFIDEGFGSLDEETRERVSDILELVRQRIDRMVGIISHVPDLAERFHQRVVVRKHGEYSTVEVIS